MSTPGGYNEYTRGFWYEWKKPLPNFKDFVPVPFETMQLYMLAFGTSDNFRFLYQVARAQTVTHFLFHL